MHIWNVWQDRLSKDNSDSLLSKMVIIRYTKVQVGH